MPGWPPWCWASCRPSRPRPPGRPTCAATTTSAGRSWTRTRPRSAGAASPTAASWPTSTPARSRAASPAARSSRTTPSPATGAPAAPWPAWPGSRTPSPPATTPWSSWPSAGSCSATPWSSATTASRCSTWATSWAFATTTATSTTPPWPPTTAGCTARPWTGRWPGAAASTAPWSGASSPPWPPWPPRAATPPSCTPPPRSRSPTSSSRSCSRSCAATPSGPCSPSTTSPSSPSASAPWPCTWSATTSRWTASPAARPGSSTVRSCSTPTRRSGSPPPSAGDQVDEPVRDVDDVAGPPAGQVAADVVARQGQLDRLVAVQAGGGGNGVAAFAVDLDDQGDLLGGQGGQVGDRPRLVVDRVGAAEPSPQLLGQVGGERRQQEGEGGRRPVPLGGVHGRVVPAGPAQQLHQGRDGGVQLEALDVVADGGHGPVQRAQVDPAMARCGGVRGTVGMVPRSTGGFGDQAPGPVGEPLDAGQAGVAPVAALLERGHEQQVHAQGVGPDPGDVVVGDDHVAAALGHLGAVLAQEAMQPDRRERLGERHQAEVVQGHGHEAGVQVVAGDVLGPAGVAVDRQQPGRQLRVPGDVVATGRRVAQEVPGG